MRGTLATLLAAAALALGLAIAWIANQNSDLGARLVELERANQDLAVAIEELDVEIWRRALELDAQAGERREVGQ